MKYFSTRQVGEETQTFLNEDAPEWVKNCVYEAHGDKLPTNWVYAECAAVFEERPDEDNLHDYCDGRVDIYTVELATWYRDFCLSSLFAEAEEEAKDFSTPAAPRSRSRAGSARSRILPTDANKTINEQLMVIQFCAIQRIAYTCLQAIKENEK